MTHGVRMRLVAFLVLSAVGVTYVAANYLGIVDKILGRGLEVHAMLPVSGGLYEGSDVTYRGVSIGQVRRMAVDGDDVRVTLALDEGTRLPSDSPMYVHNLSAVGEQYLDFEPVDDSGPYAEDGDVMVGDESSIPVQEDTLLIQLDELVSSLDGDDLAVVVEELGDLFEGTGRPLQRLIDSTTVFVREARAASDETSALLNTGLTVLRAQSDEQENIRSFARDLGDVAQALAASDDDLRTTLTGGAALSREVDTLLRQVEPTLPVMLGNLVSVNQVITARLSAVEQLLVLFPRLIAGGFTGTPGDGFGHINLQLASTPQPCREGYLPPRKWRQGNDLSDKEPFGRARCKEGPPVNMRGSKYAPEFPPVDGGRRDESGQQYRVAPYDPETGRAGGVRVGTEGGLQGLFGDDSWKWLLLGPVSDR
ncbi:MAG: MlaD family protein [Nocardioides sp.]|nr:MlaD family protein [Nocardioides sp.]